MLSAFFFGLSASLCGQAKNQPDSLSKVAGLLRPNDFFKENPRWNNASTDQFTHLLDGGLYGYYGPQPKILVDGIPIDADFFGWQNLNTLPLFVDNVRQATSRFTPQVYKNTLASAGLIDFKTAVVDTGFSISSTLYVGNETGDPGPFVFDSLRTTPNIDRWGPDGSIFLSYKKGNWYSKGLFSFRIHQPTDLILNQRIQITASDLGINDEFVNYKEQITTKSGLLETAYKANNWNIKARGIYGEATDYLFLQPFGREIPAKTTYSQFALKGQYQAGNWILNGEFIAHNKSIGRRFPLHTFIFDWDQTTYTFSSSALFKAQNFSVEPGLIYERLKTRAPGINQPFNDLVTLFLDSRISLGRRAAIDLHTNLDYDEDQFAETIQLDVPVSLTEHWEVTPSFLYTELLPLRQNSFAFWVGRGYTFADALGISIDEPLESFRNESLRFKIANKVTVSENFALLFEQQLTRHNALNVPWQIVRENEFVDTLPGTFTATSEEGERLSLVAQIDHSLLPLFHQQLTFQLQHTLTGTDRYKEYSNQIPGTKISYQFDVFPVPNLSLSLKTIYRTSTEWAEFEALDGVEYTLPSGIPIRDFSGTFDTDTPAFVNLNISVRKWFWNRHVSTQFSLKNVFNEEVRTHTLGAELSTKFDIKIGLNF